MEAIKQIIDSTCSSLSSEELQSFHKALLTREEVLSTSIGMGIAIPHARLEMFDNFFLALGIHRGGIYWPGAIDHLPVRLIFLLGGSPYQQTGFLQMLSSISATMKQHSSIYHALLNLESPQEVMQLLLTGIEANGSIGKS
jgi:PTS system nitrogen regulatory IIA component